MKLFKIYLIIFACVLVFVLGSRFFPSHYYVEQTVIINKPVSETFAYMSNYHNWEQWSLWNKSVDSTLYYFYNQKHDTIGARQYFYGALLGQGHFETIGYKKDSSIQFTLSVNRNDITAAGVFIFKAIDANTTELHWIDSGNVGNNPIKRYMIPFVTKNTAKTLDGGLANIKKYMEMK
ncbi:MAG: SRPBCC family protein [Bacteroidia bacterium]|nr:SRPBCC family protein [Bacteroidia bacterium]MBP9688298.1 SRPBCC family protein [Bacteroidia bacterium]